MSSGPHLDRYQSFISCFVETRNYSILSLAFIASSFRVTEENLVFETVQSGPNSSFECFLCLKGTHFYRSYYIPQAQQPSYFIGAQRSAKYIYLMYFNYRKLCRT